MADARGSKQDEKDVALRVAGEIIAFLRTVDHVSDEDRAMACKLAAETYTLDASRKIMLGAARKIMF